MGRRGKSKKNIYIYFSHHYSERERKKNLVCDRNVSLTAQSPLAHVGTLLFAWVKSPFAVLLRPVFDDGGTRAGLGVTVGKTRASKL